MKTTLKAMTSVAIVLSAFLWVFAVQLKQPNKALSMLPVKPLPGKDIAAPDLKNSGLALWHTDYRVDADDEIERITVLAYPPRTHGPRFSFTLPDGFRYDGWPGDYREVPAGKTYDTPNSFGSADLRYSFALPEWCRKKRDVHKQVNNH